MTKENLKTIAVGMSGGVDSTVAAHLLKKQGHNVIGITMKIWDNSSSKKGYSRSGCYGPGEDKDIEDAQKAAKKIGVPHYVLNLQEEYEQAVLDYFRNEYIRGKTPNPCVICNQKIKFGLLLDKAQQSGISFDSFATGHYARIEQDPQSRRFFLKKSIDPKKDQTYFLYRLKPEQLNKTLFPLGGLLKNEVKKMASEIGLKDIADKPESQDFYEGDCYADFFEDSDSQPGAIIDISGCVVGRHRGVIHYTIGQRKGLKIGGLKEPLFVIDIDSRNNQILVGPREYLLTKGLIAEELNWLSIPALTSPIKASAKIRSSQPEKPCEVIPFDANRVRVDFEEPQMSITPGQSIVFYDGDIVVGGGVIQQSLNT
jgi:tRNA-specific 2-thiouridylase